MGDALNRAISARTNAISAEQKAQQKAQQDAYVAAQQRQMDRQRSMEQAAVASQNEQSWYGTLLDNFWMDDFQKGFIATDPSKATVFGAQLPGAENLQANWQELGGDKVNAATTGLTEGYDKIAQGASWAISAAPGGIGTLDWDTAAGISPAQTALANARSLQEGGTYVGKMWSAVPSALFAADQATGDTANPLYGDNFDVTNKEQRDAAFTSGALQYASGATDFALSWFLDPLVLAGKAVKVARFGSEAHNFMGLTNRQLTTAKSVEAYNKEVEVARAHLLDPTLPRSIVNEQADFIVRADYTEAANFGPLKAPDARGVRNPHADVIRQAIAGVTTHDDAVTLLSALAGNGTDIARLRDTYHSAFDALTRARSTKDVYESAVLWDSYGMVADGPWAPAVLADAAEKFVDAERLLDDLTNRYHGLGRALGAIDEGGGAPLLTNIGGRSVTGAGIAGAWRAGKAERDLAYAMRKASEPGIGADKNMLKFRERTVGMTGTDVKGLEDLGYLKGAGASRSGKYLLPSEADRLDRAVSATEEMNRGTKAAAYERIFHASAGFRRVRVWSWLTGEHASGYLDVRGLALGSATKELNAALNDSKTIRLDPEFKAAQLKIWSEATSVEGRMAAVRAIEKNVATRLAEQHGVDTKTMDELYKRIDAQRSNVVDQFTKRSENSTRAFGVDPGNGDLLTLDPVFRSQLETKMPMLDFAMLEKTAKLASRPEFSEDLYHTGHNMVQLMDEAASLWKASVLLRLGYTQRNVAEGWLRTAAILGTIPALANAPRGITRVVWTNRGFSGRGRMAKKIAGMQTDAGMALRSVEDNLRLAEKDLAASLYAQPGAANARAAADEYARSRGLTDYNPYIDYQKIKADLPRATEIAAAYDKLPRRSTEAKAYYKQMAAEVEDQFKFLTEELGIKIEFVDKDPYANSTEMWNDVRKGQLKVFKTAPSDKHPYLTNEQNNKFRAVHDFFGHAATGKGFGQHGEEAAWVAHSQMFGKDARRAMTTETRGQNSWFHNNNTKGAPNYPQFATQKAALLPEEYSALPPEFDSWVVDEATLNAMDPKSAAIAADVDRLRNEQERLQLHIRALGRARAKYGKRRAGDEAAFAGANGGLYRDLASADETVRQTLESKWARDAEHAKLDGNKWSLIAPGKPQYWNQLAQAGVQMRNDEAAVLALQGGTVEDLVAWIRSDAGRSYRRDGNLTQREIEGRAQLIHDMVHNYFPTEASRRAVVDGVETRAGQAATPQDLEALLGGRKDLSAVHGKEVEKRLHMGTDPLSAVHTATGFGFKWLGSVPETRLVRQPFYNAVWQKRVAQLQRVAEAQGTEITADVSKAIEKSAHAYALRAVNDSLYTIERYSNPAAKLKFIAPFFPAWENSMKVWLGIIARDPSVAVHGSMLWNIPNEMGMVVDKDGNKVASDPLAFGTGSIDRYIVMPQAIHDGFQKAADKFGDVPVLGNVLKGGAAVPLKIAQGSLNVVSPGTTPWLPGFGPMVVAPAGMILQSKPDVQKKLRDLLGDAVYQQVVPFGVASGDLTDTVLPPALRKAYQAWNGESDANYLGVVDAMMESAMVAWNLSGNHPEDKPSVDEIRQKANDFFLFSEIASVTLPVSTTRISDYQPQIDFWNNLKKTPGMSYSEKVDFFLSKQGEAYLPLLANTSKSATKNLDPTIETYNVLNANPQLVDELASMGSQVVGILGASAPLGQFDQGTAQFWQTQDVPGSPGEKFKQRVNAQDMQTSIESNEAWRVYNQAKANRDSALARRGGLSIDAKANADIKAQWQQFTDVYMAQKYGDAWTVPFNDYTGHQAAYLEGINKVLNNGRFMASQYGQSPLWQNVSYYMQVRDQAKAAILGGASPTVVNEQFAQWANRFRFTSLEFSDFFDNYLANDKLSIGVSDGRG